MRDASEKHNTQELMNGERKKTDGSGKAFKDGLSMLQKRASAPVEKDVGLHLLHLFG